MVLKNTAPLNTQVSSVGLLWQHQTWGAVSNWQLDRDQVRSMMPIDVPTPVTNWQLVGNGDFDRDDRSDLFWRNQQTGQNRLTLGSLSDNSISGNTVFGSNTLPTVSDLSWQVMATEDFNQDGNVDICWQHQDTGEVRLWLMNKTQIKLSLDWFSMPDLRWKLSTAADFNQDGSVDLVWRHQESGDNIVWLMHSMQRGQDVIIDPLPDRAWQIADAADIDQDGQTDLLWRHSAGYNSVWAMQNLKIKGFLALPTVADQNWQVSTIVDAAKPPQSSRQSDIQPPAQPSIQPPVDNFTDLEVSQLTLPTTPVKPGETISLTVQTASAAVAANTIATPVSANASAKLSFFLSKDASISSRDLLLDSTILDVAPNGTIPKTVQQTIQLPDIQDDFWHNWQNTIGSGVGALANQLYLGAVIDSIDPSSDRNRANNQVVQAIAITPPTLRDYEFTYYYDGQTKSGDFYRGTVTAYDGYYAVDRWVDVLNDQNQANQNGAYLITASRPSASLAAGNVSVTEYYDVETKTSYSPNSVAGSNYLGSESGFIRSQQSNTDRFGYDFYEADVWLTRPIDPKVGTAPRSKDLTVRSLLNPFLNYWNTADNGGIITYSFYQNTQTPYYGREKVSEPNNNIKKNVRQILSTLELQLNVRFVEVEETATNVGVLRYLESDGEGDPFYAYTYYPSRQIGGDVHLNQLYAADLSNGFGAGPGSYGYRSLLHETLHALGLKHPGNYDAGSGFGSPPFLYPENDNSLNSIMSYNVVGANPITLMNYDLLTLQYLYGARSYRADATRYEFNNLSSYRVGSESSGLQSQPVKQLLWDAGGEDTLDFSSLSNPTQQVLDLRPGGIVTTRSVYNNQVYNDPNGAGTFVTSGYGTTLSQTGLVEHVVNSASDDYIVANQASNRFSGYRLGTVIGNDEIELGDGSDIVVMENYRLQDLKVSIVRDDLVLDLAGDGSIRLLDYFSYQNPLQIQIDGIYYRYSQTQGWQQTIATGQGATGQGASNQPLALGVSTQQLSTATAASNDQIPSPDSFTQNHRTHCNCPSCHRLPLQLIQSLNQVPDQWNNA